LNPLHLTPQIADKNSGESILKANNFLVVVHFQTACRTSTFQMKTPALFQAAGLFVSGKHKIKGQWPALAAQTSLCKRRSLRYSRTHAALL
jgi:hypothetical protein